MSMEAVGGDGFLISTPFQRTSRRFIVEVTEGLVPALQRRGLMRTAYSGKTLREVLAEDRVRALNECISLESCHQVPFCRQVAGPVTKRAAWRGWHVVCCALVHGLCVMRVPLALAAGSGGGAASEAARRRPADAVGADAGRRGIGYSHNRFVRIGRA